MKDIKNKGWFAIFKKRNCKKEYDFFIIGIILFGIICCVLIGAN